MRKRTTVQRIPEDLDEFMQRIAIKKASMIGKPISKIRVGRAIPRLRGIEEALLGAEWIDENPRRRRRK